MQANSVQNWQGQQKLKDESSHFISGVYGNLLAFTNLAFMTEWLETRLSKQASIGSYWLRRNGKKGDGPQLRQHAQDLGKQKPYQIPAWRKEVAVPPTLAKEPVTMDTAGKGEAVFDKLVILHGRLPIQQCKGNTDWTEWVKKTKDTKVGGSGKSWRIRVNMIKTLQISQRTN